jgi:DNA primase
MPLIWDEVDDSLDPRAFTIRNAPERMEKFNADPLLPVLEIKPDLAQVLEQLATLLTSG